MEIMSRVIKGVEISALHSKMFSFNRPLAIPPPTMVGYLIKKCRYVEATAKFAATVSNYLMKIKIL